MTTRVLPRGLLLMLLMACTGAMADVGSAVVVRDVARVYNMPDGREVDRLRRGERVGVLGVDDQRRGRFGTKWVRVRRPGPERYRGWMRARDLSPIGVRGASSGYHSQGANGGEGGGWAREHWSRSLPGNEIPIVDMDMDCGSAGPAGHFRRCVVTTLFELSHRALPPDALLARVTCRVVLSWTGISGDEHLQAAEESEQIAVPYGRERSAVTLSYRFGEPATGALVDSQRCFAEGF